MFIEKREIVASWSHRRTQPTMPCRAMIRDATAQPGSDEKATSVTSKVTTAHAELTLPLLLAYLTRHRKPTHQRCVNWCGLRVSLGHSPRACLTVCHP